MNGLVSLVGAGPGDPALLTLKARERLSAADVVIYDTLANPEHLRHMKASAKAVCVGKYFRRRPLSQRKINRLILEASRKGQNVVRLKGGDPYLFGRGAEEALYLYEHQIPFEVVPGVTSAAACAAYAGIPLTHREHNASVTLLTGHRAHDKELDSVPWESIAALRGTVAVYMGFYSLDRIARQLIRAGMPSASRVSVIEWGTLPRQRTVTGTLSDITRKVKAKGLGAPAMIVIGEVNSLKDKLNWYERLPLFGKRIVITRTRDKSGALADKLRALGAQTLEFPTIAVAPASDFGKMDDAIRSLARYDWLVFTSSYGVAAFFDRLAGHGKDARFLKGLRVACVGPETARELAARGLHADLVPPRFETAAIAEAFKKKREPLYGKNFLLVRTSIAPPDLDRALAGMGARVTRVTGYRTKLSKSASRSLRETLLRNGADFVTFTSSSTVDHFAKILGPARLKRISKRVRFASIGPVTSRALKKHGLKVHCEAGVFTVDGLVEALCRSARKGKS